MPSPPLTQADLERLLAATPGFDGLTLAPTCHPARGTSAHYYEGAVALLCHHCGTLVARIAVAPALAETGFDHTAVPRALKKGRVRPPTHG